MDSETENHVVDDKNYFRTKLFAYTPNCEVLINSSVRVLIDAVGKADSGINHLVT